MIKSNIDEIDQKILNCLISNARMPFLEIARECGISGVTVHQRVKKLEVSGVITGSRLIINPKVLGYTVSAYVEMQILEGNRLKEIIEKLESIPEIVQCEVLTGKNMLVAKMFCRDNEQMLDIMFNNINCIKGVANTELFLTLGEAFERQVRINLIPKQ